MIWPGRRWIAEAFSLLLSLLVLAAGGFYTFVGIFNLPRPGFALSSRWVVTSLDVCANPAVGCPLSPDPVRPGDQVVRIGSLTYDQYRSDYSATPFAGFVAGDIVPLQLIRDGRERQTTWQMPVPSGVVYWLGAAPTLVFLPFWLAGTTVLVFMRPRNRLWLALVITNYALALWTVTGANSSYQAFWATYVYIATSWILPPAYIRLHRQMLGLHSRLAQIGQGLLDMACVLLAGLTLLHLASPSLCAYAVGITALAGLALLLARRRAGQPAARQAARLMIAANLLAFGPGMLVLSRCLRWPSGRSAMSTRPTAPPWGRSNSGPTG